MIKGGYKIIDFKGTELGSTAVEISGIYNQIVDDYNKPIMVSGVLLDGELQDDAYASVSNSEDTVTLTVYGGSITVTDDDEVTFAVLKSPAELTAEIGELDNLETINKDNIVGSINEVNSGLIKYVDINVEATDTWVSVTLPDEIPSDRIVNVTSRSGTNFNGCLWWINKNNSRILVFLRINTATVNLTVLDTSDSVTVRVFYY